MFSNQLPWCEKACINFKLREKVGTIFFVLFVKILCYQALILFIVSKHIRQKDPLSFQSATEKPEHLLIWSGTLHSGCFLPFKGKVKEHKYISIYLYYRHPF